MPDVTLAGEVKDWLTSVGIVIGGGWAVWRFGHAEWLRHEAEKIPSLEGSSSAPEICGFGDDRVAVSLRWNWRNAGTNPLHVDDDSSFVEIYRLTGEIGNFVDPRQREETLTPLKVGVHHPLMGYGFMCWNRIPTRHCIRSRSYQWMKYSLLGIGSMPSVRNIQLGATGRTHGSAGKSSERTRHLE